MSKAEAADVLARRQRDNLCVAFLRAPDGGVHFRSDGEVLVPASRLRQLVRASALALSVAACTAEDERVEPVDLELVEQPPSAEQPSTTPPPVQLNSQGKLEPETDEQHYEVLAGAPPMLDEVVSEDDGELHVRFEALEPIRTPQPTRRQLLATDAARGDGPPRLAITLTYCVDEKGRVVDAQRVGGDEQIAKLLIEQTARWRFVPYEVDGRKTRVCTRQTIHLVFERPV
jgi:hypothetical protein